MKTVALRTDRLGNAAQERQLLGRASAPLIAVLTLYLALALIYSLTVPIFEAPDEPAHFLYANDLAQGDGLPILDYAQSPREYHQPPLYYWLVAGVLRWFDTDGYKQFTVRNPHAAISDASTLGNKNAYVHDPQREGWPFKGLSLAVHAGRLVSLALGLVTVWATYQLAWQLFSPSRPVPSPPGPLSQSWERGWGVRGVRATWLAAAAAALVAFNPQFLFISGALNNDNAVAALSSLALWAAAAYYRQPRSLPWLAALGLLSGLAILTKTTGLAVLALFLAVLAVKAVRQGLLRTLWLDAGLVVLLAALIGGWWYARNALLYNDPLLSDYIRRWLSDQDAPRRAIQILHRFEQGEISFWGTFGWLSITWDEWIYRVLRTWTRLSGLGLLVLAVRWLAHRFAPGKLPAPGVALAPLAIALTWAGLVAALLVQWIWVAGGLQGRLLFPAISALAVLLLAGWTSLAPSRWALGLAALPVLGLAALAIATPFATIRPAYARPVVLAERELPSGVTPLDLTYAERVKLIGYRLDPPVARPGERLDVTLYWQALQPISQDFSVYVHLFGRSRQRIATIDTYPGLGSYPTSQWQAGQIVKDVYPLRIAPDAAAPTLVTVSVGWYDFHGTREGIHALDSLGRPTTEAGRFKLVPHTWPDPGSAQPVTANFGNVVSLVGYDLAGVEPLGGQLTVILFWRCDAPPGDEYTVFAHVLDGDGDIVAQMDRPPLSGDYPTSVWEPGEMIQDELTVPLPPAESGKHGQPPHELRLRVGLYRSADGMRLPVFDAAGQVLGDSVTLPAALSQGDLE